MKDADTCVRKFGPKSRTFKIYIWCASIHSKGFLKEMSKAIYDGWTTRLCLQDFQVDLRTNKRNGCCYLILHFPGQKAAALSDHT